MRLRPRARFCAEGLRRGRGRRGGCRRCGFRRRWLDRKAGRGRRGGLCFDGLNRSVLRGARDLSLRGRQRREPTVRIIGRLGLEGSSLRRGLLWRRRGGSRVERQIGVATGIEGRAVRFEVPPLFRGDTTLLQRVRLGGNARAGEHRRKRKQATGQSRARPADWCATVLRLRSARAGARSARSCALCGGRLVQWIGDTAEGLCAGGGVWCDADAAHVIRYVQDIHPPRRIADTRFGSVPLRLPA